MKPRKSKVIFACQKNFGMAKEMNREEDGFFAEATDQENVLLLCLFPFPWYLLKVEKCDQCCTMRRFEQCQSFRESSFLFQYISPLFYRIVRGERPKNILQHAVCNFRIRRFPCGVTNNKNFQL